MCVLGGLPAGSGTILEVDWWLEDLGFLILVCPKMTHAAFGSLLNLSAVLLNLSSSSVTIPGTEILIYVTL